MADNKRRGRFGKTPEDSESPSIFDLFEPPPSDQEPTSFGKIPIIRDDSDSIDLTDVEFVEAKAAAEVEAAGLKHWTEPATGQAPAALGAEGEDRWAEVTGPSWQGEDQNWDGPDLSDVFADTAAISHERVIDLDDDDELPADPSAAARGRRREATRRPAPTPAPSVFDEPARTGQDRQPDRGRPAPAPAPARAAGNRTAAPPPAPAAPQAADPTPAPERGRTAPARRPVTSADRELAARRGAHDLPDQVETRSRLDTDLESLAPEPTQSPAAARPERSRPADAPPARQVPRPERGATRATIPEEDEAPTREEVAVDRGRLLQQESSAGGPRSGVDLDESHDDYDEMYDDYDEGAAGSRSFVQRVLVGIALAAVVFVVLRFGPVPTMVLIGLLTLMATMELFNAMRIAGLRPATLLGLVGAVAVPAATYVRGEAGYPLVVGLAVVFGMLWYLTGADTERPVLNLGLTLTGIMWIGGLAGFGALMIRAEDGIGLLLAAIIITASSDTMAYIGGRAYGRKPFHAASPNKTWEGTLTGFFGALFAGLAIGVTNFISVFDDKFIVVLVLAAVVGVLAPIGDLAESLVKRDLGIKDMGTLLPGHGGVLDRVDGLLFALPGAYYVAVVYELIPS